MRAIKEKKYIYYDKFELNEKEKKYLNDNCIKVKTKKEEEAYIIEGKYYYIKEQIYKK